MAGGVSKPGPHIGSLWPGMGLETAAPVAHKVDPSRLGAPQDLGQRYRNPPDASLAVQGDLAQLSDSALLRYLQDTVLQHFGDYAQRGVKDQLSGGAKPKDATQAGLRNIEAKLELLQGSPYAALRILLPVYHRLKADHWSLVPRGPKDRRPEAGRHLPVPIHGDLTPSNLLVKTVNGEPVIETHDYDEANIHGPRSIDLERGAAALLMAATALEVSAGHEGEVKAEWEALIHRLEQSPEPQDQELLRGLKGAPGSKRQDVSRVSLSGAALQRLEDHVAALRHATGMKAVEAFARAYRAGIQHFVEHSEAKEFPWASHLQKDRPEYAQALRPLFEKSAKGTLDRQLAKWADPDEKRFHSDHPRLEPAPGEKERWQAVMDVLKDSGEVPSDATVHDVAHRMLSGGGSLGIYKRYLLVESQGELQLWQAKEPTASSAEAHAPFNMIDVRSVQSRPLFDLDDARRSIRIKAMHHGVEHTGEYSVRFDGIDHILSQRDPTRVTFDAKRVAVDQVEATAHLLGIEAARAHVNGVRAESGRVEALLQGVQGEDFVRWLSASAEADAAFIRRSHRLLRSEIQGLQDAVFKRACIPALEERTERRRQKRDGLRRELEESGGSKALRKKLEKAEEKFQRSLRQLEDARTHQLRASG